MKKAICLGVAIALFIGLTIFTYADNLDIFYSKSAVINPQNPNTTNYTYTLSNFTGVSWHWYGSSPNQTQGASVTLPAMNLTAVSIIPSPAIDYNLLMVTPSTSTINCEFRMWQTIPNSPINPPSLWTNGTHNFSLRIHMYDSSMNPILVNGIDYISVSMVDQDRESQGDYSIYQYASQMTVDGIRQQMASSGKVVRYITFEYYFTWMYPINPGGLKIELTNFSFNYTGGTPQQSFESSESSEIWVPIDISLPDDMYSMIDWGASAYLFSYPELPPVTNFISFFGMNGTSNFYIIFGPLVVIVLAFVYMSLILFGRAGR